MKKQNWVIWTQIVLLLILKPKIFIMKILQMMLIKDLTHQFMNSIPLNAIDHCLWEKKKVVALRAKTYSYLRDGEKLRKTKEQKKCVIEIMLRHQDYKNCLMNNKIILKLQQRFKSEDCIK